MINYDLAIFQKNKKGIVLTVKLYKTVWVRASMGELQEKVTKQRQTGTRKVTKTRGLFKKESYEVEEPVYEDYEEWVPTGKLSKTFIDIADFSERIMDACNLLAEQGYEVVHISDIIDGHFDYNTWQGSNRQAGSRSWGAGWGYGYGYSVTDGVIITAKLQNG